MPELGFIGRYARLGALVALLSGCGATHQASQGEPAIERQGLREALPFTALVQQRYTPDDWPEPLVADVLPRPAALFQRRALVGSGSRYRAGADFWRNAKPSDLHGHGDLLAHDHVHGLHGALTRSGAQVRLSTCQAYPSG